MTVRPNWWVENGLNYLKGSDDNPLNPPLLSDDLIVDFIQRIPQAKQDFESIYPSLGAEEKARITRILQENPMVQRPFISNKQYEDRRQTAWTRQGIYTPDRYGWVLFRG